MKFKNSKKKGDYGVGAAIAHYTKLGYTVSIPITDSQDYDLIVEDDHQLQKIQVKTTSTGDVGLRILGGNKGSVQKYNNQVYYDVLFAICDYGDMYEIPKEDFKENRSMICLKSPKWDDYRINP